MNTPFERDFGCEREDAGLFRCVRRWPSQPAHWCPLCRARHERRRAAALAAPPPPQSAGPLPLPLYLPAPERRPAWSIQHVLNRSEN